MPPYLLDAWVLVHLATFGAAAHVVARGLAATTVAALALALGVGWEAFELLVVEPLAGWHEPWYNRWVTDLCADVAGACLGAALMAPTRP